LLADQTLEANQFQTLQSKQNAARDLLGDIVKELTSREMLLNEAIGAARTLKLTPTCLSYISFNRYTIAKTIFKTPLAKLITLMNFIPSYTFFIGNYVSI
jgi:hypothetical protein